MTTPTPTPTTDASSALAALKKAHMADLMSRISLGDRAAFRTLYEVSAAHLLGVILRIQGNRAVAEEVLQEVFVTVWQSAQSFNPALSQAATWLSSVARNRAIDSLRRAQSAPQTVNRYQMDGDSEETDMLQDIPSEALGPLDLLEQASDAHALQQCMAALNKAQRRSLALAFYQGLTHAEVAEQLGEPLGTVKSWVRRGLTTLKACLERASVAWS
jgi:RNA polymerase sigma factor (sigma-70 family)